MSCSELLICSVLLCVAGLGHYMDCVTVYYSVLQCVALYCGALRCAAG